MKKYNSQNDNWFLLGLFLLFLLTMAKGYKSAEAAEVGERVEVSE